ncbi:MAG: GTPase ObgE [Myxococcota bacterium]
MKRETFVDEATITVTSGDGGNGCVSFRREKFVINGGPDGGDGGRGGNIVLVADRNRNTLLDFRYRRKISADSGTAGSKRGRTGASGKEQLILVPVGTAIFDADAEPGAAALVDLTEDGQRFVVARGGRGGHGNTRFKTSTRQAPDFAIPGQVGITHRLRLSLKLLADVGLIGLPNAGKSTLVRRISAARPTVADYPFTTLIPCLGVVERGEHRFVVADIPGLVEGASEGVGLGDLFLRHIERTRVIAHLLDAGNAAIEERDPMEDYKTVREELRRYRPELLERSEVVVLNKIDLLGNREDLRSLEAEFSARGHRVLAISGATGEGVGTLVGTMAELLDTATASAEPAAGKASS